VISKAPIVQSVINFLLPPQCALCHEITKQPYTLCSDCWPKLKFITSPKCCVCCVPLENVDHDMHCADCLKHPPIFSKAYAPLVYNDSVKKLILRYKNYDGLHLGPMFLQWMQRCIPNDIDVIIPVPLHWWRFFTRQYNQATELGKLIAKHTNVSINPNLLKRVRATASQGHKSKLLRYENLKDAFTVTDSRNILQKASVLLVDDVLTSGATANACAQMLLNAGAIRVDVLTIARAIKGTNGTP
jgi:ComF family protein